MSGPAFDDARLESPDLAWNESLRRLATAGARIRRAALSQPLGRPSIPEAEMNFYCVCLAGDETKYKTWFEILRRKMG